jgi:hypothetical protein
MVLSWRVYASQTCCMSIYSRAALAVAGSKSLCAHPTGLAAESSVNAFALFAMTFSLSFLFFRAVTFSLMWSWWCVKPTPSHGFELACLSRLSNVLSIYSRAALAVAGSKSMCAHPTGLAAESSVNAFALFLPSCAGVSLPPTKSTSKWPVTYPGTCKSLSLDGFMLWYLAVGSEGCWTMTLGCVAWDALQAVAGRSV